MRLVANEHGSRWGLGKVGTKVGARERRGGSGVWGIRSSGGAWLGAGAKAQNAKCSLLV